MRITMCTLIQVIALFPIFLMGTANAQQPSSEQSETGTGTAVLKPAQETSVDKVHGATTKLLRDTVGNVDSFFVNDYYSTFGDNSTRLRLRLDTSWVQDHGWEVKPKVKFHLVLPGLGERVRLVMNDDDTSDSEAGTAGDETENDMALRWMGYQSQKASLSYDLGLRIKSGNLDPFLRMNSAIQYNISKNWYGQTSNRLFYYSKTSWRDDFRQSFNRKISDDMLFRARTRVQYFDENDFNPFLEQKFSLFQTLNKKSAIAYEALWRLQDVEDSLFEEDEIEGELQDNYQNIQLRFRYRRNVWRDWLYVEVWPVVGVAEERDWDTVLGAFFRLEITFGGKGKSKLSD
jgi:hypothetical protein